MSNATYTIPEWQGLNDDPYTAASNPNGQNMPNQGPANMLNPRYTLHTSNEFFDPRLPIEWIVDGVIAAGTVSVFFGDAGSKKTWALLDMAVCVLHGKNWINFKTTKKNVLYIDEDMGKSDLDNRGEMVWRGHKAPSTPFMWYTSLESIDLGSKADQIAFESLIRNANAGLVIVDIFRNVIPGRDENSSKDLQPVLFALRKIAEKTGAAIVLIHHENKSKGYSGSTAIKGSVDLMVQVESKSGSDYVVFRILKSRKTKQFDFNATANFMSDSFWLSTNQNPIKPLGTYNKAERYTLLYLFNNGESSSKDILDGIDPLIDPAPKSVSNAMSKLKNEGLVERTDNGATTAPGTYKLTPKGEQEAENL